MKTVGLSTHIYNNLLKSTILLILYPFLLFIMFWVGTTIFYSTDTITYSFHKSIKYSPLLITFTLIWFTIAYFMHSKMIQMATGAKPVTRKQFPKIYNMLENLCISKGLAMPKFQVIDSPALNAFASGLSDKTYTITLTRGLISSLQDDELEAVIAHELTHIINRDVKLLVIGVIFVGMISFFAEITFRMLIHGGRINRYSSNNNNKKSGGILLIAFIVLIIGYIFALVIRFSLSRKREFLADAGAVELTKSPEAMMKALMRISGHDQIKDMPNDIQQMCIENASNFMGIFATHPPIEKRIKTISMVTNTPIPRLPVSLKRPPKRPWHNDKIKE